MRDGFTLVELSIVLVIIGLLIGGILVGQSLIESAGIQSFVRQVQQFDVATYLFKDKYRDLPGDSELFNSPGNGNGTVENDTSWSFDGEVSNFYRHLSQDKFSPDGIIYDNDASSGVVVNTHIPEAAFKGESNNTGVALYRNNTSGRLYYYFCDFSSSAGTQITVANLTAAYTPSVTLAIDTKIDNGEIRPSNVTTDPNIMWTSEGFPGSSSGCYDGSYEPILSNSTAECCILIEMSRVIAD